MNAKVNKVGKTMLVSFKNFGKDFKEKLTHVSSETVHWLAVLCLHAATAPNLIGLMFGMTDTMPPIDIVAIIWSALLLLFLKAVLQNDRLNMVTIGLGFMAQAVAMALIFFK
jgi:hypothetical protein